MLIIFFTILSGYFSLMQTALSASRHTRIEKLANAGDKGAQKILPILESPSQAISATQLGITLANVLAGFFATVLAYFVYLKIKFVIHPEIFAALIALTFVIFMVVLFGGLLPKMSAQQTPEKFLISYQKSFRFAVKLMSPFSAMFWKITEVFMMIMDMNAKTSDAVTEDEVKELIEQGTEEGTFEESERAMVDKIFHLSDQTVYALMTPRVQMIWLDISDGLEKNLKVIRENNLTVFPVGEGSLDDCRGVVYAKDLLDAALNKPNEKIDLSALIKKPIFVPRTMDMFRLVEKFKASGESVAMVNDEYGGVIGFITLDDIAQEIVGIKDVEILEDKQFQQKKENSWLVDGLYEIDDFKKRFNIASLPNEEGDHFKTMGGFLTSQFGYIPKVGEIREWNNFRFEVEKMDGVRIAKILVTLSRD